MTKTAVKKSLENESASFQTYSYLFNLDPLNSSNVGDFSWSWILEGLYPGSKRVGENSLSYVKGRRLHVLVVQWTWKMYLRVWCTCRAIFVFIKPNVFWRCRYRRITPKKTEGSKHTTHGYRVSYSPKVSHVGYFAGTPVERAVCYSSLLLKLQSFRVVKYSLHKGVRKFAYVSNFRNYCISN